MGSGSTVDGLAAIAGRKVAVCSGTLQEGIVGCRSGDRSGDQSAGVAQAEDDRVS